MPIVMGTKKKPMYLSIKFEASSIIESFIIFPDRRINNITIPIMLPGTKITFEMSLLIRLPAE
jgi:hypothetical protein